MNEFEPGPRLRWKFPAVFKNVEIVCAQAGLAFERYVPAKRDRFALRLLLREALNNAVLHGCKEDPLLNFSCRLEITDEQAVMEISDDGPGFDWHKETTSPTHDNLESGRGLQIYALYAHSTTYNPAGNSIHLIRNFEQGDQHG